MTRVLLSFFLFIAFFVFETSFLNSLPWFFPSIPFVFGISVFLIQHYGISDGAVWIFGHGLLLDVLHLDGLSFTSISAVTASFVAVLCARHIFSNRSFYGVISCAGCSFASLIIVDSFLIFIRLLSSPINGFWRSFIFLNLKETALLIVFVGILFIFGQKSGLKYAQ